MSGIFFLFSSRKKIYFTQRPQQEELQLQEDYSPSMIENESRCICLTRFLRFLAGLLNQCFLLHQAAAQQRGSAHFAADESSFHNINSLKCRCCAPTANNKRVSFTDKKEMCVCVCVCAQPHCFHSPVSVAHLLNIPL